MISSKLAELYVDLITRDKLTPAIEGAKAQISRAQLEMSALGTSAGQAKAIEFAKLNKEAALNMERLRKEMDLVTRGKFAVAMSDMAGVAKKFGMAINELGGGGMGQIVGTMAAGFGIVNAAMQASPAIWDTFTGSINYAAAALGTTFTPVLIDLSIWIQRVARYFLNMDDDTKALIGTLLKWGVVIVGGAMALNIIGGAFYKAGAAVYYFASALKSMLAWLMAHPLIATLTALGLVIGVIAAISAAVMGTVDTGLGGSRGFTGTMALSRDEEMEAERDPTSREEMAAQRIALGEAQVERELQRQREVRRRGITPGREAFAEAEFATAAPFIRATAAAAAMDIRRGGTGDVSHLSPVQREAVAAGGASEFMASRAMTPHESAIGLLGLIVQNRLRELPRAGVAAAAGGTDRGDTSDFKHNIQFQSQFFGIEQQWQRIQQASASTSPLETERMRLHRRQAELLLDIANNTGGATSGVLE